MENRAVACAKFRLQQLLVIRVNAPVTKFLYLEAMGDSLDRLYRAVLSAKDLDPAVSRTARLLQRGSSQVAKKMAEEAVEVVIDAVQGNTEGVIRESADLLYNLSVLWVAAGVRPEDVWSEMDRRESLYGIAGKLPKPIIKVPEETPAAEERRPIVALDSRRLQQHT